MKRKWIILISSVTILILLAVFMFFVFTIEGPDKVVELARKKLAEAALVRSAKYAPEHYNRASMYYDSAMLAWTIENRRFIIFREYLQVIDHAEKSVESSEKAIQVALKYITRTEADLGSRISALEKEIAHFEKKFGDFPFSKSLNDQLSKSKLQFQEGISAYQNDNYAYSISKLDSSEELIRRLFTIYEEKLEEYFDHYDDWNAWIGDAIAESKKNRSLCIVIDKVARECMLYRNGKIIRLFNVELGPNWMGDKEQQGDKRTPEGSYKITKKKSGGETRYYKALLLNYPNEEDKARFSRNKKKGIIGTNARIGNLIEIHGKGGKGIDWTDGCIALKNFDMDELFRLCPAGTPVVIVGSSRPLKEVLQIRK